MGFAGKCPRLSPASEGEISLTGANEWADMYLIGIMLALMVWAVVSGRLRLLLHSLAPFVGLLVLWLGKFDHLFSSKVCPDANVWNSLYWVRRHTPAPVDAGYRRRRWYRSRV